MGNCVVVVRSWRWAVLGLMSQIAFLWHRDAKKMGGWRVEGRGYCSRVCCWRRMNERMNKSAQSKL